MVGLAILVLSGGVSVSCSKDEMNERKIVGKWQSESCNYKVYKAGELVYEESETCIGWYIGFNFKDDGTGQAINYEEGDSETLQVTWVVMGDKLMVTNDGTVTFDIVDVSSKSMTLTTTDEYTEQGLSYKDVVTYNLVKIN